MQIGSQAQKSASATRSSLKQHSLRSVSTQQRSQSQTRPRYAHPPPWSPRYQTHLTQHKAEKFLRQNQRRTPVVPVPPALCPHSNISLITSSAFSHFWCLIVFFSNASSYIIPVYIYSLFWGWLTFKPQHEHSESFSIEKSRDIKHSNNCFLNLWLTSRCRRGYYFHFAFGSVFSPFVWLSAIVILEELVVIQPW